MGEFIGRSLKDTRLTSDRDTLSRRCRFAAWLLHETLADRLTICVLGLVTAGVKGVDVMFDKTDRATLQIYQGRQGNHTRFVNHSCEPNCEYDSFVWLGKKRIVLVSKSVIKAGEEITVDYGTTYWHDLVRN